MRELVKYLYKFGPFRLDPHERLLLRGAQAVPLAPKVFDTLLLFVRHSGQVLNKDELISQLWPGTFVEESNLTQSVYALRKALGDRPDGRPFIETLPRRGYRFVAEVRELTRQAPAPLIRSLAVLPFRPLGVEKDVYLQLGVANAIITKLSSLQEISVRSTNAILKYVDCETDLGAAGRELEVDALLDGTIERAGDQLRVTVQLVRAEGGVPLWAEQFNEQFTNIFALEDSISEQIARVLRLKLSNKQKEQITKRYTENVEAYQAYLRGRYFWDKRTEEEMKKAIGYFEQAITLDRGYALALSGLADTYFLLGAYRALPPSECFPQARQAAEQALKLDDTLAEAHCTLAYVKACYDWDWQGAERGFKRTLSLNPNYATGHIWYSDYLSAIGRFEEALNEVRRALELDPLSLINNLNLALPHYFARQYDSAIEQILKALELDPYSALGHWSLGQAYRQSGKHEEALGELHKATELSGGSPLVLAALGHTYAVAGQPQEAHKIIAQLQACAHRRYVSPYEIAVIFAGLGEPERAFEWLDRACEEHAGRLFFLRVDPYWDNLREYRRFTSLLQQVGLKP
jgi:DNA-binding winged helix-turn-helix (wHTH) protein/tetratricopeptide (TPR) repeat protein